MKQIQKIPPYIAISIDRWIAGKKLNFDDLANMAGFYRSLGLKHDASKLYHRGLSISKVGFNKFLDTGKLKLKTQDSESWSCSKPIAYLFANKYASVSGLVLSKKIPKNKMIINLVDLYEYYKDTYLVIRKGTKKVVSSAGGGKRDYGYLGKEGFRAIQHIHQFIRECEILSETVCTSCSVNDMSGIVFVPDSRSDFNSNSKYKFAKFLNTLKKVDKKAVEFVNLVKSNSSIPYKKTIILDKVKGVWRLSYDDMENYSS